MFNQIIIKMFILVFKLSQIIFKFLFFPDVFKIGVYFDHFFWRKNFHNNKLKFFKQKSSISDGKRLTIDILR
jgi:hypothetical protein